MILKPVILAIPQHAAPRTPQQVARQREHGRLALGRCAKRCGAPVSGWEKDDNEVPLPNAGFYWSVSHKRRWAAAVIANHPVGIDIEHIAPRPRELHDALANSKEWTIIGDRSWPAFFRLWTAKEAVLKATGVGIAGLLRCRLIGVPDDRHMRLEYEGKPWLIEHFHHADHVVAVTCDAAQINWCVLENA